MSRLRIIAAATLALAVESCFFARAAEPGAVPSMVTLATEGQPPYRLLDESQAVRVALGRSIFETQWVAPGSRGADAPDSREGLGPLYNATACATCHPGGARGSGPTGDGPAPAALEIQLETRGETGKGDPVYGHVFNTAAVAGVVPEGVVTIRYTESYGYFYPDGIRWHIRKPHYQLTQLRLGPLAPTTLIKPRLAPALFGVGLLEAVPQSALGHSTGTIGRFGWQEDSVSIRDQTSRAFSREMGITSADRPDDDCTPSETECALRAHSAGGSSEISEELLSALVAFERELAVPRSSAHPKNATLGSELFVSIGCADCHLPHLTVELPTERGAPVSGSIAPYSDLGLHDLGVEMADEDVSGAKVPSRWRTAPLWGLGYRVRTERSPTFLHDGRAESTEEAILWHGGEAARSRRQFTNLGPRSRAALLDWLETL